MIAFRVRYLHSSRSAVDIIAAVKALDSGATVRVNTSKRWVDIAPSGAQADELRQAITKANFKAARALASPAVQSFRKVPPKIPFEGSVLDLPPAD